MGIGRLYFTKKVRSYRREGQFSEAKRARRNALLFNAVSTLIAAGIWAYVIYQIVVLVKNLMQPPHLPGSNKRKYADDPQTIQILSHGALRFEITQF